MQKFVKQIMLLCGLLLVGIQLQAQATLSVQGTIVQNSFTGGAAAIDNGQYDITFKLYTTDAGGTAVWTETQTISIVGGVYSALLGAVNPLNVPFDQLYFLGLTLPGGPEHTPRAQLTAAPYALSLLGQDNKFPSTGNVGIGTTTPGTTLDVDGSVATEERITVAPTVAVDAQDHVIFLDHTANQNITLPAASASEGRHLMLVNKEAVAKTLTSSNYVDLTGATATSIPANGVVELQSDGSVWRQTGGYVQPTVSTQKALVFCQGGPGGGVNSPNGTLTTMTWLEVTDTGNNFNGTTFTAPRTGVYQVSGYLQGGFASFNSTYDALNIVSLGGTCSICSPSIRVGLLIVPKIPSPPGYVLGFPFAVNVYMTAGQTFFVQFNNSSGNQQTPGYDSSTYLVISEN